MIYSVWGGGGGGGDDCSGISLMMSAIAKTNASTNGLPDALPFFHYASDAQAKKSLTNAGFHDIKTTLVSVNWPIRSAQSYIDQFKNGGARIGSILRQQPKDKLIEITRFIEDKLSKYTTNEQGLWMLKTPVFIAVGTK